MKLKYSKKTLPNGIRVITAPIKNTNTVSVQVNFGVGSRHETKDIGGIAHFLEHMAFKGTKKRPTAMDISKEIDGVGGSWNAFTEEEMTAYYIHLSADKLELAMDILSDMLINPNLDPKEIKKEKGVILEEIKMYNDDPGGFASLRFQELMFGDTPLGRNITGTPKSVLGVNRGKFVNFRKDFYNPDNTVVSISGNISEKKAHDMAKKMFGKIKGKTTKSFEKNIVTQDGPQIRVFKKDNEQSKLIMGFRSFGYDEDSPQRYARQLLGRALGGYMSSRLFSEVREKKGLAYTVRSWSEAFHDTGYFVVSGGFDPAKLIKALETIFKVLRDSKTKGFSEHEIKMGKENSAGKLNLFLESVYFIADYLGKSELLENKIETPEEYLKGINKVTNSDLKKIAQELFRPENLNIVAVGPFDPKVIETKIKSIIKL